LGEVQDDEGRKAAAVLHGPEGGLIGTARSVLAVVKKVVLFRLVGEMAIK
jgi:hypothetical protein